MGGLVDTRRRSIPSFLTHPTRRNTITRGNPNSTQQETPRLRYSMQGIYGTVGSLYLIEESTPKRDFRPCVLGSRETSSMSFIKSIGSKRVFSGLDRALGPIGIRKSSKERLHSAGELTERETPKIPAIHLDS